jgi:hypothetical protein
MTNPKRRTNPRCGHCPEFELAVHSRSILAAIRQWMARSNLSHSSHSNWRAPELCFRRCKIEHRTLEFRICACCGLKGAYHFGYDTLRHAAPLEQHLASTALLTTSQQRATPKIAGFRSNASAARALRRLALDRTHERTIAVLERHDES